MTYARFKSLTRALLIGDVELTSDNDEFIGLLSYSFERISNDADAMKLLAEKDTSRRIVRNGPGGLFVRMPELPEHENDELDIDEELCYAASRFICSFVSQGRSAEHINEASKIINSYNQKVQAFLESLEANNEFSAESNAVPSVYGSRRK